MRLTNKTILGLVINHDGASVVQVSLGRKPQLQRAAQFQYPRGASLEQPETIGAALRDFLPAHHFTARQVRVGIPARWVIAQEQELPPSDQAGAIAMLQLNVERLAMQEVVFDVAGALGASTASRIMLVGVLKRWIDAVQTICRAAGLKASSIEPTALAVGRYYGAAGDPVVMMGDKGGELVWNKFAAPIMLRHLVNQGDTSQSTAATGGQIRRVLMMRPSSEAPPQKLLVWNRHALSDRDVAALSEAAAIEVQRIDSIDHLAVPLGRHVLNGDGTGQTIEAFAPVIAVALSGARKNGVNFVSPRLVQQRAHRFSRPVILGVIAVIVGIVGLMMLYTNARSNEQTADQLEARVDSMQPQLKNAKERLDRLGYGRRYFDQRPAVLDFMADVAKAFGRDSSIWATNVSFNENGKGTIHGKASSQSAALALRDRLEKDPHFSNLQLLDLRESTGTSRDVSFSMSFVYTGAAHAQ